MSGRVDPVKIYNFSVTLIESSSILASVLTAIHLPTAAGFSECSGLEAMLDVEEYKEGGNNGTILKFPARANWGRLRLRRGVANSGDLWQWYFGFASGAGVRRDGLIILHDDRRQPVRLCTFRRGIPVKWTGPALHAAQSQVAIEEVEIAHEGLQMTAVG